MGLPSPYLRTAWSLELPASMSRPLLPTWAPDSPVASVPDVTSSDRPQLEFVLPAWETSPSRGSAPPFFGTRRILHRSQELAGGASGERTPSRRHDSAGHP